MNNNIKVAKQLIKLAKNIIALDGEGNGSGFQIWHDFKNLENEEQFKLYEALLKCKKYILHHQEGGLWRIQACKDFGDVKKGDFGGLIESEANLSQKGDCWVYDNAKVYGKASVKGNAKVFDGAEVYSNAKVYGNALVYDKAQVYEYARVYGNETQVGGNGTQVYDHAQVYDDASVLDGAKVYDNAQVFGDIMVCGNATKIHNYAEVNYDVEDEEITESLEF